MLILMGAAALIAAVIASCSGPSKKEVDASQNAQCVRWGAKLGSSDYIQCRATLAVNYQREQEADDAANAAGAAMVMSTMNAGRK
jgi:hypothetical protein